MMNEILQIINNVFIPYLLSSHPDRHFRMLFPSIDLIVFDRSPKVTVELAGEAINVARAKVQPVDSQVDILCN
jgi:hypothetical protein